MLERPLLVVDCFDKIRAARASIQKGHGQISRSDGDGGGCGEVKTARSEYAMSKVSREQKPR